MRKFLPVALLAALLSPGVAAQQAPPVSAPVAGQSSRFAALVAKLSEEGGDFASDNLISNEQSYLRVLPALSKAGVTGGAYLGVGPDQNFSYIAQVKPAVAFIIDIRRDNLLIHLLFKAIFAVSPTRIEYLCALTGRAPPPQPAGWATAGIDRMIAYVDKAPAPGAAERRGLRLRLEAAMKTTGVSLGASDLARIAEFHGAFIDAGLWLMFQARGRPPTVGYPSLRDLLGETDGNGRHANYLAVESAYQFVRSLQQRDLVIPVVGDISGPHAMAAIAAEMRTRGTFVSAIYVSNIEQYLFQDGRFPRFALNLQRFPKSERTTIIRSVFPSGFRGILPQSTPDSYSTSLTQPLNMMLDDVTAGRYRSYWDLVLASSR
jgi:hypothetical protein